MYKACFSVCNDHCPEWHSANTTVDTEGFGLGILSKVFRIQNVNVARTPALSPFFVLDIHEAERNVYGRVGNRQYILGTLTKARRSAMSWNVRLCPDITSGVVSRTASIT